MLAADLVHFDRWRRVVPEVRQFSTEEIVALFEELDFRAFAAGAPASCGARAFDGLLETVFYELIQIVTVNP